MTKLPIIVVAVVLLFPPLHRLISADQELSTNLGIEVPGMVHAVYWSPGDGRYGASLQMIYFPVKGGKEPLQPPKTQVWLLKPDGSVIPPRGHPATGSIGGPGIQYNLMYPYDHNTAVEAVAVAVLIEGHYFIKALPAVQKSAP